MNSKIACAIRRRKALNGCLFRAFLLTAGLIALATGCVERQIQYVPVYQNQQTAPSTNGQSQASIATNVVEAPLTPPPPKVEVVPIVPGPEYVWIPGYWAWNGGWVWIGGRWVIRPHIGAIWVAPHWARHPRGYVWVG